MSKKRKIAGKKAEINILNKLLEELESSGFIKKFIPYNKAIKQHYFRVVDEYTMFYLNWIEPIKERAIVLKKNHWHTKSKTPSWQSWAGYAFEIICYKHTEQIANKLKENPWKKEIVDNSVVLDDLFK